MTELQGFHCIAGRWEMSEIPLLLLHGSNRSEKDLISLADEIAPCRPYISLRGRVDCDGGFAFFRRNADRSLDYDDLAQQTLCLVGFIKAGLDSQFLKRKPILLGFSNGAIIASSVLFREPQLVSAAILMRPLSPAPAGRFPELTDCPILLTAGEQDERRSPDDIRLIAKQLEDAGAIVSANTFPTGHELHRDEPQIVRAWLDGLTL